MNYFPEMIRKWRMILHVYFHKLKASYFSRTSFFIFLKAEFIAESVNFSFKKHLVDFFTLPRPWFWYVYSRLLLIYFFLFYYYGFLCFLDYLEQVWQLSHTNLLLLIAIIIFLAILPSGNFLVSFVTSFGYFFLIFLWWYNYRKTLDSTSFILVLLLLVTVVRPLWRFVIKTMFHILIKQIYPHSWFQKLLPYLSPNFDPLEIKNPNEDDDSKNHT